MKSSAIPNQIRLLPLESMTGIENMAIDLAIVDCCRKQQQPTLRFYQWTEPTLSLGYFQAYRSREGHDASTECKCVRRSTGGGAILHHHELTYSWVAPSNSDKVAETDLYTKFHQSLIRTLQQLGVQCDFSGEDKDNDQFLCFNRRTSIDVVCQGQKLAGSAQRRKKGIVLQHGSVLLRTSSFAPELPGVAELVHEVTATQLAEAWEPDLAASLGAEAAVGGLSQYERARAAEIAEEISAESYMKKR